MSIITFLGCIQIWLNFYVISLQVLTKKKQNPRSNLKLCLKIFSQKQRNIKYFQLLYIKKPNSASLFLQTTTSFVQTLK